MQLTVCCAIIQECTNHRLVWSQDGKSKALGPYIDSLRTSAIYVCGTLLPEDNPGGCYINDNLKCEDTIAPTFYKLPSKQFLCCVCASERDQELIQKYHEVYQKYSTVKPTCESADCGPFQTSRQHKVSLK